MRTASRLLPRLLACLLVAGVLLASGVSLFHTHFTGTFRPDCPACHQERTLGSSSAAVTVAVLAPTPVLIGPAPEFHAAAGPSGAAVRRSSPRSPPLTF